MSDDAPSRGSEHDSPYREAGQDDAWHQIFAHFDRAQALSANERAAYLDAHCPAALREEVEQLLSAADESGDFLEDPADVAEAAPKAAAASVGDMLGPYRLLRLVGEGGMGVVYEAEQPALDRRVALKLIKLGMDTREVVSRFEAERQTLALMAHPNIASVLDAAETPEGRPFFVMEFVQGEPIDHACDRRDLSVDERLRLFLGVCAGVEHAHRRGIIHRDLKPSNLLVTEDGVPKVIDFGIAKAIDSKHRPGGPATVLGSFVGTPEYMSPEQCTDTTDIDTRVDVYALGVVLYELLVGTLPHDLADLGHDEIRDRIRTRDPTRPSTAVRQLGGQAARIANARRSEPEGLANRLHGELDWILMKALARDREERYGSVAELADDIERHLDHRPVLAGPPSRLYRARKFARRHTRGVALAALALLLIVGAALGLAWQSYRLAAALEREAAERARAEEVQGFLVDLFRSQDPTVARGQDVTGRELLERGVQRLSSGALADQPLVEAELFSTTGTVAYQLGDYEAARRLQESALDLRRSHRGPDHADVAKSLRNLGLVLHATGDYDAAIEHLEEALAILEDAGADTSQRADVLLRLGVTLQSRGDRDGAAQRYEAAFAAAQAGASEALEAEILGRQASLALERRDLTAAQRAARQALERQERLFGEGDPRLTITRSVLAHVLHRSGQHAQAAAVYRENLAAQERVLGTSHPQVGNTLNGMGAALYDGGRDDEATPVLERALEIFEGLGDEGRAQRSSALANLALIDHRRGDYDAARQRHEQALALDRAIHGPESAKVAADLNNLGWVHHDAGDLERAASYYRRALAMHRKIFGPDHPSAAFQLNNLAELELQQGRAQPAAELAREGLDLRLAALPTDHALIATSQTTLGGALIELGRASEALPLLRRALAIQQATYGEDDWHTADTRSALGACLVESGDRAVGLPMLRSSYEALLAARGPDDRRTRRARQRLDAAG